MGTRHRATDGQKATERLGQASAERPEGAILWAHADTPEEAGAAVALTHELARTRGEPFHTLITTSQPGHLVPSVAEHSILQLVPGETSGSIARFLDHWRPEAGVFLGNPDRPNLILAAKEQGVLLYLAATQRGVLTSRSRLSLGSPELLNQFDKCLAASAADAEVLDRHLDGGRRVEVAGPFSDTAFAPRCSDAERDTVAMALKGRPVWLAAYISDTEIDSVEEAHQRAYRFAHRLLLVIIPSDSSRGVSIAARLETKGWKVGRSSIDGEPRETDQVFIADSGDEDGLWYRLAPSTFVGGTLDETAPSFDPFAPATLGSAVLNGPHTGTAKPRFDRLAAANANLEVASADALGKAVQQLLAPDKAAELAQAGWQVTTEGAHVVERLTDLISTALDEREGH